MYITLVSVVQAIALESLAARAIEVVPGLAPSGDAFVVWMQILLLGQTVFYVWISYTLLVTLTQWIFRIFDFGAAFGVGVLQFVAIALVGRESPAGFLLLVTLGFVAGACISHSNTGAAARSPENRDVIDALPRWRITLLLSGVALLGSAALGLSVLDAGAWYIGWTLLLGNGVLLVALFQWFGWWKRVLAA